MKKNAVKVCIRTRPTQNYAQDNIFIDQEHNTIQINTNTAQGPQGDGLLDNKQSNFKFKFDHVFHNATQTAVYDLYARDTVQTVVDGINGAILSYGQTGSGKTYTMMGDAQSYDNRGVAPRALNQLFNEINSRIEFEFRITCTYMEIYNERIFDLLNDLSDPNTASDYTIAEEKDGRGTFVRGLAEVEVKDENQALNLLFSGGLARTIATHKLNRRSNRSHSVFTIYLQQRQRSGVSERVVHSKLHLVDLAGSERLKKTMDSMDGTIGDEVTRKESMAINQSLTYLEQCVVALARRGASHIPYRQSKLTNILKDCLGANCNTVMIACMWGEANHLEETISTLRLASRMMRVQNETVSVETIDPSALIKKQEKIIKALKQELLMHDALIERTGVAYDPYTPEQQDTISQMLERYLEASELEEEHVLDITNYRQMIEICKQFKKKVTAARYDAKTAKEQAILGAYTGATAGGTRMGTAAYGSTGGVDFAADSKIVSEGFDPQAPLVGDTISNGKTGFSLGVTSSDAKPTAGIEGLHINRFESKGGDSFSSPKMQYGGTSPGVKQSYKSEYSPTKSIGDFTTEDALGGSNIAQFESFARGIGKEQYKEFVDVRTQAKDFKNKSKTMAKAVNEAKFIIDQLVQDIEARKASRIELLRNRKPNGAIKYGSKDEVVDEEEFRLAKELKEAKAAYKSCFEQMQKWKASATETQMKVNYLKNELANRFQQWNESASSPGKNNSINLFDGTMQDNDQLDDQEAFDKLEIERVLQNDPESLAFFHAQKTRLANLTQSGASIRQIQKNKRFT
jgi:kinesin family protein 6/9